MKEIWKPIPGYEGYYEVSNTGKYRSVDRAITRSDGRVMHIKGRELKLLEGLDGYALMNLTKDCKSHAFLAHRIVCKLFLPDWDPNLTVNHKDGNKFNNCVENLEMMTIQENVHHFHTSPVFAQTRKRLAENASKIFKGRKRSAETVEKWKGSYSKYLKAHGGPRKGAIISDEVKQKISFSQGKHVRCIEKDLYFTSYQRAAQYFDVDITTMIYWCNQGMNRKFTRRTQKCSGLHFEVTDEPDISKYIF